MRILVKNIIWHIIIKLINELEPLLISKILIKNLFMLSLHLLILEEGVG